MTDWHFAHAKTWTELVASHDKFVADYNYQIHRAHQDRQDDRHSPAEVLGWVQRTQRDPAELHRIFYAARFSRKLDKLGYVRFRHWRIYGEHGLARTVVQPRCPGADAPHLVRAAYCRCCSV
jgi:hypothetical protein